VAFLLFGLEKFSQLYSPGVTPLLSTRRVHQFQSYLVKLYSNIVSLCPFYIQL
jgi:hypothetical protein